VKVTAEVGPDLDTSQGSVTLSMIRGTAAMRKQKIHLNTTSSIEGAVKEGTYFKE